MFKSVAVYPCFNYADDAIKKAIYEILNNLGGPEKFIKKGYRVLIKPNMLAADPVEKVVTTNPSVVKAVIEIVWEYGGIPFVGDSSMEGSLEKVAEACGILQVVNETGATLLSLEKNCEVQVENAHTCKIFQVSEEALKVDLIINLPKLKTHTLTGLTAAVKNCYGLIGGKQKKYYHVRYPLINDFGHILIDLYLAINPGLSILDAVIGMEGLGPRSGRAKLVGALMGSSDALALDAVAASKIGYSFSEVSVLKAASERGLIKKDLSDIKIIGPYNDIVVRDFDKGASGKGWSFIWRYIPAWVKGINERKRPWPSINDLCVNCGKCVEHCPVNIITKGSSSSEKVKINYHKCIRCYCCQEICPHGAVSLKRSIKT